ncbi:MAG: MBL fold metallo-hydrolase [Gammaproteobacteria bacterium]|nr:MBL fold metallo-hydrolase [Gammaproteobacteria bacterium]
MWLIKGKGLRRYREWLAAWVLLVAHSSGLAHDAAVNYLANEAVLLQLDNRKVLFDPFFHNDFGHYQKVPEKFRQAIFLGEPPYNDIDIIFISHAHEDHFSAVDVARYLAQYPQTQLVAPQQAVTQLQAMADYAKIESQLHPVALLKDQAPQSLSVADLAISAVRIPHAGWPARAEVENIVFYVRNDNISALHFGDADPQMAHFNVHKNYFKQLAVNLALPPYWFLIQAQGVAILQQVIKPQKTIGIHVPIAVPDALILSGYDYFSISGQQQPIPHKH